MHVRKSETVLVFVIRTRIRGYNGSNWQASPERSRCGVNGHIRKTIWIKRGFIVVRDAAEKRIFVREVLVNSAINRLGVLNLYWRRGVVVRECACRAGVR